MGANVEDRGNDHEGGHQDEPDLGKERPAADGDVTEGPTSYGDQTERASANGDQARGPAAGRHNPECSASPGQDADAEAS